MATTILTKPRGGGHYHVPPFAFFHSSRFQSATCVRTSRVRTILVTGASLASTRTLLIVGVIAVTAKEGHRLLDHLVPLTILYTRLFAVFYYTTLRVFKVNREQCSPELISGPVSNGDRYTRAFRNRDSFIGFSF